VARTRRRPETGVPAAKNNITSKEALQDAERRSSQPRMRRECTIITCWGVPSRVWALTSEQGQRLPSVEERVEEEAPSHMTSTVQQEEGHRFQIPSDFHEEYKILLAATEADWTRSTRSSVGCFPTVGS
jgi:hypothetical protein